jgi:peptidoglycan/xylan/chitin deacetylase (PgdA/CDA1 family)
MRLTVASGALWAVVLGVIAFSVVTAPRGDGSPSAVDTADAATAAAEGVSEEVSTEALALPAPLPTRSIDVPILIYHRVDVIRGEDEPELRRRTVEPQEFQLQMRWLADEGYTTLTQRELFAALMEDAPLPERPVMIAFDEGYRSTLTKAAPIMDALGLRGTAYVTTRSIVEKKADDPVRLTWNQLRILQRRGIEIGSATTNGRPLVDLPDARIERELRRSRLVLERRLGRPVQWLAYPGGDVDPRVESLAEDVGYVLAVTPGPGIRQSARTPLRLTGVTVTASTGVPGLAAALAS